MVDQRDKSSLPFVLIRYSMSMIVVSLFQSSPRLTHLTLSHIRRHRGTFEVTPDLSRFPIECLRGTLKSLVLHETEFDSQFLHRHVFKCQLLESLDISQIPPDNRFGQESLERPVSDSDNFYDGFLKMLFQNFHFTCTKFSN